jgi:hypothetical protein
VTTVSLRIDSDHIGDIRAFNINLVENLLTEVVKFIGEDSTLDSDSVIVWLADKTIGHLSKPPDACIEIQIPFLYHWLRIAKSERLISTQK